MSTWGCGIGMVACAGRCLASSAAQAHLHCACAQPATISLLQSVASTCTHIARAYGCSSVRHHSVHVTAAGEGARQHAGSSDGSDAGVQPTLQAKASRRNRAGIIYQEALLQQQAEAYAKRADVVAGPKQQHNATWPGQQRLLVPVQGLGGPQDSRVASPAEQGESHAQAEVGASQTHVSGTGRDKASLAGAEHILRKLVGGLTKDGKKLTAQVVVRDALRIMQQRIAEGNMPSSAPSSSSAAGSK